GNGERGGLEADRGTRRAFDAGSVRVLPRLARRRPADVGRTGDNAPRRRRLPARRTPGDAAHDRLPELATNAGCSCPIPDLTQVRFVGRKGGIRPAEIKRPRTAR